MQQVVRVVVLLALFISSAALASVEEGDRLTEQGEFERAIQAYQEVLQVEEDPRALYGLARTKAYWAETLPDERAAAFYEEAIAHAKRAVELAPDDPEAHFELARAYGRLAQFRGVLESLNLAGETFAELSATLELDPEHDGALHALALWHLNVPWLLGGRTEQVRPLFERAIELNPERVTHYVDYAEALLQLGDPEAARARLEQARAIPPKNHSDRMALQKAEELSAKLP